jgi:hypothetical protein
MRFAGSWLLQQETLCQMQACLPRGNGHNCWASGLRDPDSIIWLGHINYSMTMEKSQSTYLLTSMSVTLHAKRTTNKRSQT